MPTDPRRAAALTDVRRSFRLLWAYQRQLLDIMRIIEGSFPNHAFAWWRNPNSFPSRGKNPVRFWAWDLLPFHNMSAFYLPSGTTPVVQTPGQWTLQIRIISDDAYATYQGGGEKDARAFADVAEAKSTLALLGWKCTSAYNGPWIEGLGQRAEYPEEDGKAVNRVDPPVSVLRKTFDLADLGTREEVERAVAEFKDALRGELGVPEP